MVGNGRSSRTSQPLRCENDDTVPEERPLCSFTSQLSLPGSCSTETIQSKPMPPFWVRMCFFKLSRRGFPLPRPCECLQCPCGQNHKTRPSSGCLCAQCFLRSCLHWKPLAAKLQVTIGHRLGLVYFLRCLFNLVFEAKMSEQFGHRCVLFSCACVVESEAVGSTARGVIDSELFCV